MTIKNTEISFFGGLKTIGGTIVLIEYGNDRIILDFGISYNPSQNILSGSVKERPDSLVSDFIKLDLLPRINGLYKSDSLQGLENYSSSITTNNLNPSEDSRFNSAVFISHLHLDHIAGMGFIGPEIPVYMTEESLKLYHLLETIGEGVSGKRIYSICRYSKEISVGDIKILPIRVDHSVPGSCGYLLKTPDCKIAYTGDFRFHGNHPDWTEEFVETVKKEQVDVLIMETTTISADTELSFLQEDNLIVEGDIPVKILDFLAGKQGLGIFNIYHRNLERLSAFLKTAKISKRRILLEPATAYLVSKMLNKGNFFIYMGSDLKKRIDEKNLTDWEEELIKEYELIDSKVVNQKPGKYFMQNSCANCLDLLDIDLGGSVYIHSGGIPLGEFDCEYLRLKNFLDNLNIEYQLVDCPGHAGPYHLLQTIDEIRPSILIPVHGFCPERIKNKYGREFLPVKGIKYNIGLI